MAFNRREAPELRASDLVKEKAEPMWHDYVDERDEISDTSPTRIAIETDFCWRHRHHPNY